jgi:cytochrome c oxidase subunit 7
MIPPITGRLRKRMWLDGGFCMGLAVASGYAYWYGAHLKQLEKQELYYFKLERARKDAQ